MKKHIRFSEKEQAIILLDQRYLPEQEKWFVCRNIKDVIYALQKMVIRGAPAIGVVAAYGCCVAAKNLDSGDPEWQKRLNDKLDRLATARPTAVNLHYTVKRMRHVWKADADIKLGDLIWLWVKLAKDIHAEDISLNKKMGRIGMELLSNGDTVMTHCNAGALATGGYGTALGVIRAARSAGKNIQVIANETRPFLQGARLTAYELKQDHIPVAVACDNAAAFMMANKMVNIVIVGADRIAANGDTANKIGTYGLAVLAKYHEIPFYVAAPSYTFDLESFSGENIPIEERPEQEVTHIKDQRIIPEDVSVFNYAFDITPHYFIQGFITERGLIEAPFAQNIVKFIYKE